jgi:chromosome segregation ATPase
MIVEKFDALENKVGMMVERLREAAETIAALRAENARLQMELSSGGARREEFESVQGELETVRKEREVVRKRIDQILNDLNEF